MEYSINGTFEQSGVNNDGSGDTTYNQIGIRGGSNDLRDPLDGKIGEIIVANTVVADTRQRLEGYLAHKWGLTANLPDGHPYKAAIPPFWGTSDVLKVDFTQNDPEPLQDGFEGFDPWAPGNSSDNGNLVSLDYTNSSGVNDTLTVKLEGQTHWRNYQAITLGDASWISDLVRDGALRNANGTMTLTLSGLKAGHYHLTTYHHDSQNGKEFSMPPCRTQRGRISSSAPDSNNSPKGR